MSKLMTREEMAIALVNDHGKNVDFRIKDAWDNAVSNPNINENQYVTLVRNHAVKVSRGVYMLPSDFEERVASKASAPKAAPKKPKEKVAVVAPSVAVAAAEQSINTVDNVVAMPNATQSTEKREFSRITSSDLTYHAAPIPAKDPMFVGFGVYQTLKKLLQSGVFAPMYIVGDSGYGKTMLVEQACAATKRQLVTVQITNETTEDDLIGGLRIVDGDSVMEYGPILTAALQGAVVLLDEIDQGSTALMCLQNLLQGKPYFIKKTGETIYPKEGFMVIATGNTKGLGDDVEGKFVGAQLLNEALLERFAMTVEQTAPTAAVEKKILMMLVDDEEFVDNLIKWAGITREACAQGSLAREIQTRRLGHICRNYLAFQDRSMAIKGALGRFDKNTADALMLLYSKIDPSTTF